jgi:hypothetical protein
MENPQQPLDLTLSITVKNTPAEVYAAINRVRDWWIGEFEGDEADKMGNVFTYAYKHYHRTVQRVKTLVPGKLVEWDILESSIHFVEDKEEWKGTTLRFEILEGAGGGTEARFTHIGLTPKIECYKNCSAGWEFYILESLRGLIETGKGAAPPF